MYKKEVISGKQRGETETDRQITVFWPVKSLENLLFWFSKEREEARENNWRINC